MLIKPKSKRKNPKGCNSYSKIINYLPKPRRGDISKKQKLPVNINISVDYLKKAGEKTRRVAIIIVK